jgi:hypothetical protein
MISFCRHTKQTSPRRDEEGEYCRCLECTARIPWTWADDYPIPPPRLVQPARTALVGEERISAGRKGPLYTLVNGSTQTQRAAERSNGGAKKDVHRRSRRVGGTNVAKQVAAC